MSLLSGKYGRRPPDPTRPRLHLSDYLTGVIPAHPPYADWLASRPGWQMLGNDEEGDCVPVTWANTRRLVTSYLATGYYPTLAQVIEVYRTQNPGFDPAGTASTNGPGSPDDAGMDIQTLLTWLTAHPGPDGAQAVGFAAVNAADTAEVQAAIAIFGSVWTGINVTQANETQFADGQPWDYDGSAVLGGHSVITGGYGHTLADIGPLGGDEKFITWAAETSFTDRFWGNAVEECWAVIWPEHLGRKEFQAGVDLAGFAVDWTAITGRPFPVPIPSPVPVPVPRDVPTMADRIMWATAGPFADAAQTVPHLVTLQTALDTWSLAKGLGGI
jgi:hypothetical protein